MSILKMTVLLKSHKGTDWGTNSQYILRRLLKVLQAGAIFSGKTILMELSLYPCLTICMWICWG
jgi:hypothetical protein